MLFTCGGWGWGAIGDSEREACAANSRDRSAALESRLSAFRLSHPQDMPNALQRPQRPPPPSHGGPHPCSFASHPRPPPPTSPPPAAHLAVLRVDGADEHVVGDVVQVAAVLEPGARHGDVVGGALALGLDQHQRVLCGGGGGAGEQPGEGEGCSCLQANARCRSAAARGGATDPQFAGCSPSSPRLCPHLDVLAVPGLEGREQLQALGVGVNLDLRQRSRVGSKGVKERACAEARRRSQGRASRLRRWPPWTLSSLLGGSPGRSRCQEGGAGPHLHCGAGGCLVRLLPGVKAAGGQLVTGGWLEHDLLAVRADLHGVGGRGGGRRLGGQGTAQPAAVSNACSHGHTLLPKQPALHNNCAWLKVAQAVSWLGRRAPRQQPCPTLHPTTTHPTPPPACPSPG